MSEKYTTRLGAGLGMVQETRLLLDLWNEGQNVQSLYEMALDSGVFPSMSARRLRNFVKECFAPRYLVDNGAPALLLKALIGTKFDRIIDQLMFIYTCRANLILADFVRQVHWTAYAGGHTYISNEQSRMFVYQARDAGKTTTDWSENMVSRVAGYLTGCIADFGLLEGGRRRERKILPYRIHQGTATILAYDLHLRGVGDNHLLSHEDWMLFGMDRFDVLNEIKRLALQGMLLYQSAGEAIRIEWRYESMEEVLDVLAES